MDSNHSNMLPYEVRDARELEQSNKFKMWIKSKIMKNPYGQLTQDEDDMDDAAVRRRVEMEKLSALTRSELADSDDEVDEIMDGLQPTGNSITGYSYASHDL